MCRLRPLILLLLLGAGLLPGCGAADLAGGGFADEKDTPPGTQMTSDERKLALEVFGLVNQIRRSHDLPELAWDEAAADAAYDHGVDMRLRQYYAHVTPDGLTPVDRLEGHPVDMDWFVAENIARNNRSAQEAVNAWMNSEGHRQAILSYAPTHLGVGVHTGRDGPWWVQEFFVRTER